MRDTFDGLLNAAGEWCEQDAACRARGNAEEAVILVPVRHRRHAAPRARLRPRRVRRGDAASSTASRTRAAGIRYGGKTDPAIVDEIFAGAARPRGDRRRARRVPRRVPAAARARCSPSKACEVLPGVVEALDVPRGQGDGSASRPATCARAPQAKLAAARARRSWFALGGYGCDSHLRAELVATAIERGRRAATCDEVIVVGDTIHDISAARACGATVSRSRPAATRPTRSRTPMPCSRRCDELPAWHAARFA